MERVMILNPSIKLWAQMSLLIDSREEEESFFAYRITIHMK